MENEDEIIYYPNFHLSSFHSDKNFIVEKICHYAPFHWTSQLFICLEKSTKAFVGGSAIGFCSGCLFTIQSRWCSNLHQTKPGPNPDHQFTGLCFIWIYVFTFHPTNAFHCSLNRTLSSCPGCHLRQHPRSFLWIPGGKNNRRRRGFWREEIKAPIRFGKITS